jgi:hypothetical protein
MGWWLVVWLSVMESTERADSTAWSKLDKVLTINMKPIHLALLHSLTTTNSLPDHHHVRSDTCHSVEADFHAAHHQLLACSRTIITFCAPATRQLLLSLAQPNTPSQHGRQTLTCRHEPSG